MAHILIADDTDGVRDILTLFLRSDGHDVVAATNGRQALELAQQRTVDLFLCDLAMPGMAGADVIREFRRAFPDIPVVAISGGDLTCGRVEGADRVLGKPFAQAALLSLVGELLGTPTAGTDPHRA
jgi:CheY-like chemotaxis protein